jgi:hypothetical protein
MLAERDIGSHDVGAMRRCRLASTSLAPRALRGHVHAVRMMNAMTASSSANTETLGAPDIGTSA